MSKPALDFVRSQSLLSQAKSDTTDAYVEDSEPEREVRRLQRKKTRVAKSRTPSQPVVIELTDSSPSPRPVAASLPIHSQREHEPIVIVDVSDGSGYSAPEDPREEYRSRKIVRKSSSRSSGELSIDTTLDESFPSIGKILGLPPKPPFENSEPPLKTTTRKAESRPVVPTPLSPVTASQGSDTEDDDLLKLGRFAYTAPAESRRTVSKTPSRSESELDVRPVAGKSKRAPVATAFTFTTDFTDAELSQIRRCVSCEQGWTVRKTVANKMKHIQTCAKKNKLTNETVRILLRKELSNTQPVASTSTLPAVSSPPASETLLEDALKDAQKKKAGRRPHVLQTVKDVSETRDVILDRARLLLQNTRKTAHDGQSAEAQGPSCVPQTQAFRRSDMATSTVSETVANLDKTHVFGPSKLDAARASRVQDGVVRIGAAIAAYSDVSPLTQIFSASPVGEAVIDNYSDEVPPSTQIFSRSKFSNMLSDSRRIVVNDEPISIHDTSEDELAKSSPNRPTFRLFTPSQSVNYPQPCASPTAHADDASHSAQSDRSPALLGRLRSPSPAGDGVLHMDDYAADLEDFHVQDDYFHRWTDWNDDGPEGAYMHYNPEGNSGITSPSKIPVPTEDSPVPRRRRLNPISEDLPVAGPSRVLEDGEPPPPEPPKKRTRKKKATSEGSDAEAAAGKDIAQEDLNARLQDAILKDETLHLRILRYEPINFEVFMKLATDLGIPAKRSGLKNKVRTFLDLKAIHFYGADPSKSRTRRVRHP